MSVIAVFLAFAGGAIFMYGYPASWCGIGWVIAALGFGLAVDTDKRLERQGIDAQPNQAQNGSALPEPVAPRTPDPAPARNGV
jgi:hypothetical protein